MTNIRIAFLASNKGTSFRAISEEIYTGNLDATAVLVVSNKSDSAALAYAEAQGISNMHIPTKDVEEEADRKLYNALTKAEAELVVLSGYLRKLGPLTLTSFEGRILNVHPALLPQYGGKGMYGRNVHEAVLKNREHVTGATIHLVDAEYDHGRTIAIAEVAVLASDDITSIERRVMQAESKLFIETIREITTGNLPLPL
ncbi:phosphoribosylglycinamide formyltransferase [Agrobacterium vitis]|uniref:phosphoribosylglycinamide formyltransferase n=1 Tax=Agrobacterium vitis TaxID=373 RepID=UPI0015722E0C|nr:phosphoribosylglycinamide formyltransferase [Agrobacterium vitis]NSZ52754.1 phosphoribosylglycinamide formyltransferase [Agrobacterium vitis]NTA31513.1 phosphoribosylglycinamide formyltransferase [Agrobacterium vitis]